MTWQTILAAGVVKPLWSRRRFVAGYYYMGVPVAH